VLKPKVLFVCIENSCRSQMAEGFLRDLAGDHFEAYSAGAQPTRLNPTAVSGQYSKDAADFLGQSFHFVVGECNKVRERCPVLPGAVWYLQWSIEDPAQSRGSSEERLNAFRRVRDTIEGHVLQFVAENS
jgi:arsenate reductase